MCAATSAVPDGCPHARCCVLYVCMYVCVVVIVVVGPETKEKKHVFASPSCARRYNKSFAVEYVFLSFFFYFLLCIPIGMLPPNCVLPVEGYTLEKECTFSDVVSTAGRPLVWSVDYSTTTRVLFRRRKS